MCEFTRVYGRVLVLDAITLSWYASTINYSRCYVYLFVIVPLRRAHNENSSATLCLL